MKNLENSNLETLTKFEIINIEGGVYFPLHVTAYLEMGIGFSKGLQAGYNAYFNA